SAITISPGLRLIQGKDFALSLTAPISIGASSRSNTYLDLGVDLPAMLETHFGSATGNQDKVSLGGILGAGVAYHYSKNYYDSFDDVKVSFGGYRFHGGISFSKDDNGDRFLILASMVEN
ncbi:MAG: hypothetical protein ACM3H8_10180, partial [Sphingobacteriales bacterium]